MCARSAPCAHRGATARGGGLPRRPPALSAVELQLGRHSAVVGELSALIVSHPMRERLVEQLMLALYRCARPRRWTPTSAPSTRLAEELGLETIFGRFEQVGASDARPEGDTGYGLTICRSIIELHGGHIRAHNTPGAGATVSFTLPA